MVTLSKFIENIHLEIYKERINNRDNFTVKQINNYRRRMLFIYMQLSKLLDWLNELYQEKIFLFPNILTWGDRKQVQ